MTPRGKTLAAIAGTLVSSTLLRRSRLARLGAIGALAATAYGKLGGRRAPQWHDVEPPP